MGIQFACAECGSPSVKFPDELSDGALIVCQQCSHPVSTWGEFKRRTTRIILSEYEAGPDKLAKASYDPLVRVEPKA
jgi:DNA-directed RNA polymerase subunit RPC12/RpoP